MIGIYKHVVGTAPAAGAEILDVVPDGVLRRVIAVRFAFTSDATAVNRRVTFLIDTGATGAIVWRTSAAVDQAASLTYTYQVAHLGITPGALDASIDHYVMPLPPGIVVRPGFRFRTITTNLQAGDQFGAAVYYVEEWRA